MRKALILGGALTVWRDAEEALALGEFDGVVACNDAAVDWPGEVEAFVTLHGEKAAHWRAKRAAAGHPAWRAAYGHEAPRPRNAFSGLQTTEFRFPGQIETGSSGLFALKVALIDLGFDRAVLCGVPMEPMGCHFFDAKAWTGASSHRRGWQEALPHIKDRARSMCGWTADLLGRPTEEWLAEQA